VLIFAESPRRLQENNACGPGHKARAANGRRVAV
jgi:hypothetical protein